MLNARMQFSVLHISDLHRDLNDEVNNTWLLDSIEKDIGNYQTQDPPILLPSICVVSGDLVYGVSSSNPNSSDEIKRQYGQAEEFIVGLADRFFDGNRENVVILPGNHDVCYPEVMASARRVDASATGEDKKQLVGEYFRPNSKLRWSWEELCFFRIFDEDRYKHRLNEFSLMYERFYQGRRKFSSMPQEQHAIHDFPHLGFCIAALNSCFNNDPLRRAGAFNPTALAESCRALRSPHRFGWVAAASWHHNLVGGPTMDDYLDSEFIQLLIDAGVSVGFHGHQHSAECFDERYKLGSHPRKITVISAGTLCAEPRALKAGSPRSYNVVEFDLSAWAGRVHQRQMVNGLFSLPVWGPGHFISSNRSFFDFELCKPIQARPTHLDVQLILERASSLLEAQRYADAVDVLQGVKQSPLSRPLLLKALTELRQPRRIIESLWPPLSSIEAVHLGAAILEGGTREEAVAFGKLDIVTGSGDASVRDMATRVSERRAK
ncbi:metallophosphoesterase family protein [Bradyrhizobium sp. RDM4]|uniref:metallophosphoesterase family protein n=1 Tax=Bradyrhizobium sp. RDM4 TaxID=3378765 RepID=UPI0038FCA545